jgi:CDP-paratose 2-epimerase
MKPPGRNGAFRHPQRNGHHATGPGIAPEKRPVLITGGAGFVGTNVAHRFLSAGQPVLIFDNLARPGVEQNLTWLKQTHRDLLQVVVGEMQDVKAVRAAARRACKVFHLAAQVAVTTSLSDPIHDFEVNARGTLNLLEALRKLDSPPPLIFTSTNKVYGDLADVKLRLRHNRYEPDDPELRARGFSEERCLEFHSPYGCSKGAACQYVLDYARTFGMPTMVFRMSCIYGLHQFGNEDQGWVAHFLIRALEDEPITIYGDGKQVRDVLFVDDLVNAFLHAMENIDTLAGRVFNIGGGPANTTSLLELIQLIGEVTGREPRVKFDDWRAADQLYYVSDTTRFAQATGWRAKVGVEEGVARLHKWLQETRQAVPA